MKDQFVRKIKNILRPSVYKVKRWHVNRNMTRLFAKDNLWHFESEGQDLADVQRRVKGYLKSVCLNYSRHQYKYSQSCTSPTLYASVYACLIEGLSKEYNGDDESHQKSWIEYFNKFQSESDGLFYDAVTDNHIYADSDWWGARHLALQLVQAYSVLGSAPRYPFKFLEPYLKPGAIIAWLNEYDWSSRSLGETDVDNKIMNVGCLLQYERDRTNRSDIKEAIEELKVFLRSKINAEIGVWGAFNPDDQAERSRIVQFAYHLFPIFFYDGELDFDAARIVDLVLSTQNQFGGYGVAPNSSACEDIDSVDLLIAFSPKIDEARLNSVRSSLLRAKQWIMKNQVGDGGFVFRLFEPFQYGHKETSSRSNEGAMFPTWFRLLSLIHIENFLQGKVSGPKRDVGYYFLGNAQC